MSHPPWRSRNNRTGDCVLPQQRRNGNEKGNSWPRDRGFALLFMALASPLVVTGCPLSDDYYLEAAATAGGVGGVPIGGGGGAPNGGNASSGMGGDTADGGNASSGTGGDTAEGGSGVVGGAAACLFGPFGSPEQITGLGVAGMLWGPALSADGLTLYLAVNGGTGLGEHIYRATRNDRETQFSIATAVVNVNSLSADGTPCLSFDGLTLYFYSTRIGGLGNRDIWSAHRPDTNSDFTGPSLLAGVNSSSLDHNPWVSRDELTLLFASLRNGGLTQSDVWTATRADKDLSFSIPTQVAGINTNSKEERAALSNDGLTIYFISDRFGGFGSLDVWYAARPDTQSAFSNASNLVQVNSAFTEGDLALSPDETELFFSSSRSGVTQLWRSVRACQ